MRSWHWNWVARGMAGAGVLLSHSIWCRHRACQARWHAASALESAGEVGLSSWRNPGQVVEHEVGNYLYAAGLSIYQIGSEEVHLSGIVDISK